MAQQNPQQQQTSGATNSAPASSESTDTNLYPILESSVDPLELGEDHLSVIDIERDLVGHLRDLMPNGDLLKDIGDKSILPVELLSTTRKIFRPKLNPLERLKELPTEEVEDEEQEDEEEDEEQEMVENEDEDDAGGDYLVSHFDNGENYEDNDDEGDDMSSMM